ncbi:hypothetical protein TNCV_1264801 [Trichonephila clavipes]|nr:hypothetical protein TNCV_1264801 [Trichonephila clavipes]
MANLPSNPHTLMDAGRPLQHYVFCRMFHKDTFYTLLGSGRPFHTARISLGIRLVGGVVFLSMPSVVGVKSDERIPQYYRDVRVDINGIVQSASGSSSGGDRFLFNLFGLQGTSNG